MLDNFAKCLAFTLLPDNDGQPLHKDTGGWTAFGATQAIWSRWIGRASIVADMRKITRDDVVPMYEAYFWKPNHLDTVPNGIDLMVFDAGVMCGLKNAAVQLQQAIGLSSGDVDGVIGPQTLKKLNSFPAVTAINLLKGRQQYYYECCATFPINGNGWLARLNRRATAALVMLSSTKT